MAGAIDIRFGAPCINSCCMSAKPLGIGIIRMENPPRNSVGVLDELSAPDRAPGMRSET